jgi:hypothetical protein
MKRALETDKAILVSFMKKDEWKRSPLIGESIRLLMFNLFLIFLSLDVTSHATGSTSTGKSSCGYWLGEMAMCPVVSYLG